MTIESTTQQSELQSREKKTLEREGIRPGLVFRPNVDIAERADEFVVTADLPGVDQDHVDVKLEEGVLSIDGRLAVEPEAGWTPCYGEYRLGGYHRQFALGDAIDVEGIEATMSDGVLTLRLPKTDRHRPRQIEVRVG